MIWGGKLMHSSTEDAAGLLRAFRRQSGQKQATIADWLGISQAHYSRIEAGTKSPSHKLNLRIRAMLDDLRYQPSFDRRRLAVKYAPSYSSLIQECGDGVSVLELSKGFRTLGGRFATLDSGERVDGIQNEGVNRHIRFLKEMGAFAGDVILVSGMWSTSSLAGEKFFETTTTAVFDNNNEVCLMTNHLPIAEASYRSAVASGGEFRVIEC